MNSWLTLGLLRRRATRTFASPTKSRGATYIASDILIVRGDSAMHRRHSVRSWMADTPSRLSWSQVWAIIGTQSL